MKQGLLLICGVIASLTYAQYDAQHLIEGNDSKARGHAIAKEVDRRDRGYGDMESEMMMVLVDAQGQKSVRRMRNRTLEKKKPGEGDKSILIFDSPRDVRGTAMLSYTKILEPDEQWLYLPALKRVKRIASRNKSGPFVGSEFAYEDITSNEVEKYTWNFVNIEPCGKLSCYVLDSRPRYEYSGYTKRMVWVDTEAFRPQKITYYDRKGALLKTQTYQDYKKYLDKYWRAHTWQVKNHQSGKSTDLSFKYFHFNNGFSEKDFTQSVLKRIR